MLTYLLELTVCWTLLYGVFFLCMRRETYFMINRWYLLSALLLGLMIPLLRFIPMMEEVDLYNSQIAEYVPIVYVIKDTPSIVALSIAEQSIAWGSIFQYCLWSLYIIGVVFFLYRFVRGLYSIHTLYNRGEKSIRTNHTIINTSGSHLPFSFLNIIFVSKDLPLNEDYHRIITHELEHVRSRHSVDVLILEIINIIFWFHPMIYLYKSALRQTHEYLADAAVCGNDSRQLYGQLLLRQSLSGLEIALAHHFFHSHIKKRINMIYQEKSGRKAWLKYALAVPALALLMLVFTSHDVTNKSKPLNEAQELTSNSNIEIDNNLSKNQQNRLRKEVQKVFTANIEKTTLEQEHLLNQLIKKWLKKYPEKEEHIKRTISYTLMKDNLIIITNDEKVKIKPLPLWLPDNDYIKTYDVLLPTLPNVQELSDIIGRRNISNEISLVHNYFSFQSYYSKEGKSEKKILELFEQYIFENNILLGFKLKDIQLKFNVNPPTILKDYINSENEETHPVFWGQSMDLYAPHKTKVDLNYPIGFYAYLNPSQSKSLFGSAGSNGLIAISNYTLSPEHPTAQSTQLIKDIENFFSTINQLPAKNWANKLKEVSQGLKSKYPNARDFVTPYTNIAHEHNITLVFKEGEIIKAYKGDGNSTDRIDSEQKDVFPQGISIPTPPGTKSNEFPRSDINLNKAFIQSIYENFTLPKNLMDKGIEGAVSVELTINTDNKIRDFKIAHSLDNRLSQVALNAIKSTLPIAVVDEMESFELSKKYALNFVIEHDGIINVSSDSLISIVKEDPTLDILEEFQIVYAYNPESNIIKDYPKKTKSSRRNSKPTNDTLSPIQRANLASYDHIDTIITYNPETYEETVMIRAGNAIPEFLDFSITSKKGALYGQAVNVDTTTIFNPKTFKESYIITTYPSHLTANDPLVKRANFKVEIDSKAKMLQLSGVAENKVIRLIAEKSSTNIGFIKENEDSDTMAIDISAIPPGYYYVSSVAGEVEVMKRVEIE